MYIISLVYESFQSLPFEGELWSKAVCMYSALYVFPNSSPNDYIYVQEEKKYCSI